MRFILGILVGFLMLALAGAAVVLTGAFNTAATVPVSPLEEKLATFALNRSVKKRAPKAANPLAPSVEVFREGLSHYRENCVVCHGAPGVDPSELGEGLNPPAPDLTLPRVQARPDGELFWITSEGIRMTGMPAFAPTHEKEEIWKIVAFLRHLPEITNEEQTELKRATEEAVHHHEESEAAAEEKENHSHAPGTPPHKH